MIPNEEKEGWHQYIKSEKTPCIIYADLESLI